MSLNFKFKEDEKRRRKKRRKKRGEREHPEIAHSSPHVMLGGELSV